MTPKTAPEPALLAEYTVLFAGFAEKVPNCCLPPKKIEWGLDACNKFSPIFFGGDIPDASLANSLGMVAEVAGVIRIAFAKYRDVVRQDRFWHAVVAKASTNSFQGH